MIFTNRLELPDPMYRALTMNEYTKVGDVSVTELLKSPRQRLLQKRHDKEIVKDACENLWSVLGTAVHSMIEKHSTGVNGFSEERMSLEVRGPVKVWTVSGQTDLLEDLGDGGGLCITDYKVAGVYSVILEKANGGVKPDWERQLNMYRLLAHAIEFQVDRLRIGLIIRDWVQSKSGKGDDYPSSPILYLEVKVWTIEEAKKFLESRVEVHQLAEALPDESLPMCTPEERWERGEKYAVMKVGNKTAFKLFDTPSDAQTCCDELLKTEKGKKYIVEHRPGKSNKCNPSYCPGAPWCTYYQQISGKPKPEAVSA